MHLLFPAGHPIVPGMSRALGFFRGLGQAVAMGTMGKNVCGWGTGAKLMTNGVIGAGAVAAGIDAVNKFGQGDMLGGIMSLGEGLLMASQLKACFIAGTPIRTPSGSKAIEELEVGDEILSRSEFEPSGLIRARRVLKKFVRNAPIVELSIAGRIIGTTDGHPFYAYDRGWINAQELTEGDKVLTENGQWLRVDGLKDSGRVETVYNIQVEEDHTYFVGETDWGWAVWAHNASYSTVTANKTSGDKVRDIIAAREAPSKIEQTLSTVGGARRIDVLKMGDKLIAIESKVGRTGLTDRVRQELARDWWLLRQKQVQGVIWEFTRSDVTGKLGPTAGLLARLQKLGFGVVIN